MRTIPKKEQFFTRFGLNPSVTKIRDQLSELFAFFSRTRISAAFNLRKGVPFRCCMSRNQYSSFPLGINSLGIKSYPKDSIGFLEILFNCYRFCEVPWFINI